MARTKSAKREVSFTAEGVAFLRAVGAREWDPTFRNPDHMAHELLDPRIRALGRVPGVWPVSCRIWQAFAPGYYPYELARTKHIDGVLSGELAHGIDQVVFVGSGYDSRVYRFADQLAGVRVFELDRPAMLERKRRRAAKRRFGDSGAVQVPLDLNLETPLRAVRQHGYDAGASTLFVCSGIVMYLDPDAADRLLTFVAEEAGAGSSICFDYVHSGALANPEDHFGASRMVRGVKWMGEPYRFGIDPPELPRLLDRNGLRLISDAGPEELERAYLTRPDGSRRKPMCVFHSIAHAGRAADPDAADRAATTG